jgi:hypothetical protein
VPFKEYAGSFTPEQLDAMSAAFQSVIEEIDGLVSPERAREIAKRIVDCAGQGIFDLTELRQAALRGVQKRTSEASARDVDERG